MLRKCFGLFIIETEEILLLSILIWAKYVYDEHILIPSLRVAVRMMYAPLCWYHPPPVPMEDFPLSWIQESTFLNHVRQIYS